MKGMLVWCTACESVALLARSTALWERTYSMLLLQP